MNAILDRSGIYLTNTTDKSGFFAWFIWTQESMDIVNHLDIDEFIFVEEPKKSIMEEDKVRIINIIEFNKLWKIIQDDR